MPDAVEFPLAIGDFPHDFTDVDDLWLYVRDLIDSVTGEAYGVGDAHDDIGAVAAALLGLRDLVTALTARVDALEGGDR